ncbi:MAG: MATE family efflux transporter [Verrucomicrobia bacterium]|nr:MATE family efflux transporter [Verrucomicrobiota bacterium]
MMAAALLDNLFTIADMFFVGKLGPAAIAGVAVAGTIMGVLYMLGVGITTGCTALVAQAIGSGNRRRAETVVGQSLVMALVISALAGSAALLARPLLMAFGAEPDVIVKGAAYLQVSLGGAFTMLLAVTFVAALRGAGDAITPLKIMGFCNLINIGLDPILIFGWLGVPALGVAGSAWATLAARALAAVLLARVFFVRGHAHFHLRLGDLRPHGRTVWKMFRIGVFGSGQMLMRNLSAIILIGIVARFGTAALAAYGIGIRLRMIVMMPGIGFGNAAATLIGQNLGARKPDRAEHAGWVVMGMYGAISIAVSVVFWVFARPLIAAFNADPEVVATGASFLRWFSATFAFMAFSIVLGRAMNGAGDTFWPMLITAVSMLALRIPLAWGLSFTWQVTGVWIGLAASNVLQGLIFVAAFRWGRWKRIGRAHVLAADLEPE